MSIRYTYYRHFDNNITTLIPEYDGFFFVRGCEHRRLIIIMAGHVCTYPFLCARQPAVAAVIQKYRD